MGTRRRGVSISSQAECEGREGRAGTTRPARSEDERGRLPKWSPGSARLSVVWWSTHVGEDGQATDSERRPRRQAQYMFTLHAPRYIHTRLRRGGVYYLGRRDVTTPRAAPLKRETKNRRFQPCVSGLLEAVS